MTHMRVGAVVWVLTTHINARQEAVVHVGRQRLLGVGFPLDGVVEVSDGGQRRGHGGGHVAGVGIGRGHGRLVGLGGAVWGQQHLVGRRVRRVLDKGWRVRALPVVVVGRREHELVLHGRRELGSWHGLLGRRSCLLRLGRGGLLHALAGRLLLGSTGRRGAVRGVCAPLQVFQASLELLACSKLLVFWF